MQAALVVGLVELLEGLVEALVGGLVVATGVLSLPALDAEVLLEVGVEVHAQLQAVDQLRDLGLVFDLLPLLELVQLVGQGLGDLLHVDLLERELLILLVAVFLFIFVVVAVLLGFLELLVLLLVLLRSFVVQLRQLVGGTGVDLGRATRESVTPTRNGTRHCITVHAFWLSLLTRNHSPDCTHFSSFSTKPCELASLRKSCRSFEQKMLSLANPRVYA